MGTFTVARDGSAREAVADFFLSLRKGRTVDSNTVISRASTDAAPKTVRNVLGMLVAEGALRRTATGYAVRSARALNTILGA